MAGTGEQVLIADTPPPYQSTAAAVSSRMHGDLPTTAG
jgi:hypothetical protein